MNKVFLDNDGYNEVIQIYKSSYKKINEMKEENIKQGRPLCAAMFSFDDKSVQMVNKFRSLINMTEEMCRSIIQNCPGVLTYWGISSDLEIILMSDFKAFELKIANISKAMIEAEFRHNFGENTFAKEVVYIEGNTNNLFRHNCSEWERAHLLWDELGEATEDTDIIVASSFYNKEANCLEVKCYIYAPECIKESAAV